PAERSPDPPRPRPALLPAPKAAPHLADGADVAAPLGPGAGLDRALTDHHGLQRALRPLRRWREDPARAEFDEEATAAGFAERLLHALQGPRGEGRPARGAPGVRVLPRERPRRQRAFDLTFLLDDSASMLLHRPLAEEFIGFVTGLGVFRRVTVVRFDSDKTDSERIEIRGPLPDDPERLFTGSEGRELALALTDGVGTGWESEGVQSWLSRWGRRCALGVVHLLRREQWRDTGLRLHRAELTAPGSGAPGTVPPNHRYAAASRAPLPAAMAAGVFEGAVAVPVLELGRDSLHRWARFATRGSRAHVGPVLLARRHPRGDPARPSGEQGAPPEGLPPAHPSGGARVSRFRAAASPTAFELAVCLAAVPLSLPIMRMVQRMLPGCRPSHLTEVLYGELVYWLDADADRGALSSPATLALEFHDGVRAALIARGGRRGRTLSVMRAVTDHFGAQVPWFPQLGRILRDPVRESPPRAPTRIERPFAHTVIAALRALGGAYHSAADHIADHITGQPADQRAAPDAGEKSPAPRRRPGPGRNGEPPRIHRRSEPSDSGVPAPLVWREFDAASGTANSVSGAEPAEPSESAGPAGPAGKPSEEPLRDNWDNDDVTISSSRADLPPAQNRETRTPPSDAEPAFHPPSGGGDVAMSRHPAGTPDPPPGALPAVWGTVPQRNDRFTGRGAMLGELESHVRSGTTAVVPTALHGLGGVGKTQLALEYLYRHRGDYHLIWWIPAEHIGQVQQSLIDLCHRIVPGVGPGSDPSASTAVPLVLEALRSGRPYRNWLLVYDNAGDPEALRPYLPTDGPGDIIVTSRDGAWRDSSSRFLEVHVFERAESVELLRKRGPELSDGDADLIAAELEDLPLAVEQAAVWLRETMMPAAEYLRLFRDKTAELLKSSRPISGYPTSLAAAWNVSLEQLRRSSPGALQLLQVCSFLAAQPIPRALFLSARSVPAPPELGEMLGDPIKLGRALRAVDRYALAHRDLANSTIQLHRLVQRVLQIPLSREEKDALRHCAHMLLANHDPHNPHAAREWPRYSELLPHVWVSAAVDCADPWARQLVIHQVQFLRAWGDYGESARLGEWAVSHWTEKLGADHAQTLRASLALAPALRRLDRLDDAYRLSLRTHEILAEQRGADDEETLDAAQELVYDLRLRGDVPGALELSESLYRRYRDLLGEEDPATVEAGHSYTSDLRISGDFSRALDIDQRLHPQAMRLLGPDALRTFSIRNAIGVDLLETGRYRDGLAALAELTEDARRVFGESGPHTLAALRSLSVAQRRSGRYGAAVQTSGLALERSLERYGEQHGNTVLTKACHTLSLAQSDRLDEALRIAGQVAESYRSRFGEGHHTALAAEVNLALVLRRLGRVQEAWELDGAALPALVGALGENHPTSVVCAINTASDQAALGSIDEAALRGADIVARCRRVFSADHPLTLAAARNLALDRQALNGAADRAADGGADGTTGVDADLEEVRLRYERVMGAEHPATLSVPRRTRADCDIYLMSVI
ncbi:FxSxx-COOH system tetratricopeptide repeat protein, partial [Spinactinospora alkalitolerans]